MADGLEINIGAQGGRIADSEIKIGDVAGGSSALDRSRKQSHTEYDDLLLRLAEIEKVLGGQWGMPGVISDVADIKKMVHELKLELREFRYRDRMWVTIYLVTATGALLTAFGVTILGLWR